MARIKKWIFPVMIVLLAASCESNHWFQSESTLNNNIQHTWTRAMYYYDTTYLETWHFSEGKLTILAFTDSLRKSDTLYYSSGKYEIKTKIDEAFITISDLIGTDPEYNKKWTIVKLDDKVLDLAGEYNASGGLMEREFSRK